LVWLKAERAGFALVANASVLADQIDSIGPAGPRLLDLVRHGIDQGGHGDVQIADAGFSEIFSVGFAGGRGEDHSVFYIALHLPHVAGVGFGDIDDVEVNLGFVLQIKLIERGNLPAKGRSGIAPEDQDDGALTSEFRKADRASVVETRESEIRGLIAWVQSPGAGRFPEGFEGEQDERDRAEMGHEARDVVRGLAHRVGDQAECGEVEGGQ